MTATTSPRRALALVGTLTVLLGVAEAALGGGAARLALEVSCGCSLGATLVGILTFRPRHSGPWWWLLAGEAVSCAGLVGERQGLGPGGTGAVLVLAGTVLVALGVIGAWRRMRPRADPGAVLDTAVATVAAGVVLGRLVIVPLLAAGRGGGLAHQCLAVLPALDALLLAVVVHLIAGLRRRPIALVALASSLLAALVANLGAAVAATRGARGDLDLIGLAWIAALGLLALGALHPSMGALGRRALPARPRLGVTRLVALGLAQMAPALAAVVGNLLLHQTLGLVALLAPTAVITALVLARFRTLFDDRARALHDLEQRRRRYQAMVEHQSDHVLLVGASGLVTYQSPSFTRLLGFAPLELVGTRGEAVIAPDDIPAWTGLVAACAAGHQSVAEATLEGRDATGAKRTFALTVTNLLGEEAVGALTAVLHDVTDRSIVDAELRRRALHDPLTGLANRALLLERVEELLAVALGEHRPMAAVFVDLDNFKSINDSLGHGAGDELLVAVAERLRGAVGPGDAVGRLGGDEFVVLLEPASLAPGVERVAERLLEALREPFEVALRRYRVSVSMGVALGDAGTPEDLLRSADIAMYQAKAAGKNCFVVFEEQMQVAAHDWLALEIDLQDALGKDELGVLYQPTIDLDGLRVTGMEALVRWHHPTRGLLAPASFIPVAEASGLIVDLGRFVLREACATAATWPEVPGAAPMSVSVNLSSRQLEHPDLVADVEGALAASGLDPSRLVLEITESTLLSDAPAVSARIAAVKSLGVRIAIDDFGTGYSSLSYLRRLPVDVLKIDQSFIASLAESPEGTAVVQTLLHLGATLGLEIVAEGVEASEQLAILRHEGCHVAQGFLFARPLDTDAVDAFLSAWALGVTPGSPAAGRLEITA